jgi:hypothetical protein
VSLRPEAGRRLHLPEAGIDLDVALFSGDLADPRASGNSAVPARSTVVFLLRGDS